MTRQRAAFLPLLLFAAAADGVCGKAEPADVACEVCGQLPEAAPFDPSQVQWVSTPVAIAVGDRGLSFQTISRVIGLQPLVLETLDISLDDRSSMQMCELVRIYSADTRLRDLLPQLRFNDVVKTTMALVEGGKAKLVLRELEKPGGARVYFHPRAGDGVCPNRTGTLAAFNKPSGETIIVHNDGSVSYQDAHFNEFNRQRLDASEVARLLQSFHAAGFSGLPSQMPSIDNTRSQPSITLICARHQRLLVPGHEAELAPVIRSMEEAKARALSQTNYVLTYAEKREATLIEWPSAELQLEKMEALEKEAHHEVNAACREKREPHGAYDVLQKPVPVAFLAKLPIAYFSGNYGRDPNAEVYCKAGTRVFRVERPPDATEPDVPNPTYYFLRVQEVVEPDPALARAALEASQPGGCCAGQPAPALPSAPAADYETSCSLLMSVRGGIMWPADTGIELRRVPASGRALSQAEYARREKLYRELLAAGNCGAGLGIDFLEGRYLYKRVRLTRVDREQP